ncbi:MoaD/ThiS family protein [bacterium]|nr:MoaD/ThiS family protein [bacterium]
MAIDVRIPTPLRSLTKNQELVSVQGSNVSEVIDALQAEYPGIKERLCTETGDLHRFLNIYLNNEDIRFKEGLQTLLSDGDELSIIPAIAGG